MNVYITRGLAFIANDFLTRNLSTLRPPGPIVQPRLYLFSAVNEHEYVHDCPCSSCILLFTVVNSVISLFASAFPSRWISSSKNPPLPLLSEFQKATHGIGIDIFLESPLVRKFCRTFQSLTVNCQLPTESLLSHITIFTTIDYSCLSTIFFWGGGIIRYCMYCWF